MKCYCAIIYWEKTLRVKSHMYVTRNMMTSSNRIFSALLAICAGNSPVTGEYPAQRPMTRSFGVFFDMRLNKRLSKQWWSWCFETPSRPLWRHCNVHHHCAYCVITSEGARSPSGTGCGLQIRAMNVFYQFRKLMWVFSDHKDDLQYCVKSTGDHCSCTCD